MDIQSVLSWLEALPLSQAVRESAWMFPTVESIHVVAICLVVGSIAMVDLRLLGVVSRNRPVTELSDEILPWTWTLFIIAAIFGSILFISKAHAYYENVPFRLKFLCMFLAGVNMLVFQFITYRSVHNWDQGRPTIAAAKIAGGLSLMFWVGVVAFGRWIGFTIQG